MRNPAEERDQLHLVEEALGDCTGIVNFNGRGFDMPLIYNRFVLAGMPLPLPARRTSICCRLRGGSGRRVGIVSLGNLDATCWGSSDRRGRAGLPDPDIYRQYYLTGVVTDMLVHVSTITWRTSPRCRCSARAWRHSSGRKAWRSSWPNCTPWSAGAWAAATTRWTGLRRASSPPRALDRSSGGAELTQILRELGYLYKRLERRDEAAEVWERGSAPYPAMT